MTVSKHRKPALESLESSSAEERIAAHPLPCKHLLQEMQQAERVLLDLKLFLDTHPMDFPARQQYMAWHQKLMIIKHQYQHHCGPLQWFGPNWWQQPLGFGYDPLDECFEEVVVPPTAVLRNEDD
jgi:spore coat protein JB